MGTQHLPHHTDGLEIRKVGFESIPVIANMNRALFGEERIINRFDRRDLVMLVAFVHGRPAGFKIGYGLSRSDYYSAKGGVDQAFRRRGIARCLLADMMELARQMGYHRFVFDTFPALHAGMTLLAIEQGFVLAGVDFADRYANYRFRFTKMLESDYS